MTQAIVEAKPTGITAAEWDAEQTKLITEVLSPGLNRQELSLFAQVCHRTGLDPFTRQIYAIKRNQKQNINGQWTEKAVMTIQTGIDGYRVIAERTGEYVGGDAPVYGPACQCVISKSTPHPEWAEVTVRRLKNGQQFPTSERADFDEYAQTFKKNGTVSLGSMWTKMPKRMIAKCAEALALRRAFPGLFEGVYTTEEMAQADNEPPAPVQRPAPPAAAGAGEVVDMEAREVPAQLQSREEVVLAGACPQCRADGFTAKSGKAVRWIGDGGGNQYCNGYNPDEPDEAKRWPKHFDPIPF